MADYKSMYYELLMASERAITLLEDANRDVSQMFPPKCTDYFDAFKFLRSRNYNATDMLIAAVRKSEDIYIATCDDDPESQD